jgi:hypothetical protein
MATEKISFVERIMLEVLVNEKIIVEGETKTIYDIQFEPITRQVLIQFTDGSTYTANKDEEYEFVRDVKRPRLKPNKRLS